MAYIRQWEINININKQIQEVYRTHTRSYILYIVPLMIPAMIPGFIFHTRLISRKQLSYVFDNSSADIRSNGAAIFPGILCYPMNYRRTIIYYTTIIVEYRTSLEQDKYGRIF